MYEARDISLLVRMANFAIANSGHAVDWIHMAGPRYLRSEDDRFFRPLAELRPGDARVFLGIVLPLDGVAGPATFPLSASGTGSGITVQSDGSTWWIISAY